MGLFDKLVDYDIVCPRCGGDWMFSRAEIQTKNTGRNLETYDIHTDRDSGCPSCEVGDRHAVADVRGEPIRAIYACRSPICEAESIMVRYAVNGSIGYSGYMWDIKYESKKDTGVVYGPAFDFEPIGPRMGWEEAKNGFVQRLSEDNEEADRFNAALVKSHGEFALALQLWRPR